MDRGRPHLAARPACERIGPPPGPPGWSIPDRRREAPMPPPPLSRWLPWAVLVLVVGLLFAYTVELRAPWFGKLSLLHHQWLSGSTVKFTRNWYREGAFELRFLMLERPRSIESPDIASRQVYLSYPPGTLLPVYALARLAGREPDASLVMAWNLANQFLIALMLAGLTYWLLRERFRLDAASAVLAGLIPAVIYLLPPAPMYWHQNVFFSDQAVMLWFVAFVVLEGVRRYPRQRTLDRGLAVLQGGVMFLGTLTDWLFVFVLAVAVLLRLVEGRLGRRPVEIAWRSVVFLWPAALALGLFLWQVEAFAGIGYLISMFLVRSALNAEGQRFVTDFGRQFWHQVQVGFGGPAPELLWFSLLLWIAGAGVWWRRRRHPDAEGLGDTLRVGALLLLPCFLQVYTFRNHSAIHNFSTLKFGAPLGVVGFVLVPILLLQLLRADLPRAFGVAGLLPWPRGGGRAWGRRAVVVPALAAVMLAGSLWFVADRHLAHRVFFPKFDPTVWTLGRFLDRHTAYADVVFSPVYRIDTAPPQWLAYSMKLVYGAKDLAAMRRRLAGVAGPWRVGLVLPAGGEGEYPALAPFIRQAERVEADGYVLYRLSRARFEALAGG